MSTTTPQLILNKNQTIQRIKRIAFEIYENNYTEKEIVIAGIFDKGYLLAQLIEKELMVISTAKITLIKVSLDKNAPTQSEIALDKELSSLKNKTIVLVDDVLNSARTLAYSLKPFLTIEVKKIQVATLVDRGHKSFPIAADYVGYTLSTTLKEHIEVILDDSTKFGVYLA